MNARKTVKRIVTPIVITGMTILPYLLAEMALANPTAKEDVSELYKTLTFDLSKSIETLEAQRVNGKKQAAEASYRLAKRAEIQGNKGRTFKLINEALLLQPENMNYLAYAADMAFNLKKYVIAETFLLKMISLQKKDNPEQGQALSILLDDLALIYQKQHRLSDSITLLTNVIELDQNNNREIPVTVLIQRLDRLSGMEIQLENYGQALTHLDKMVTIYQSHAHEDSQALAKTFHNIGEIRRLMNNISEAESAYRKAMTLWDIETEQGKNGVELTRKGLTHLKALSMTPAQIDLDHHDQPPISSQDKT